MAQVAQVDDKHRDREGDAEREGGEGGKKHRQIEGLELRGEPGDREQHDEHEARDERVEHCDDDAPDRKDLARAVDPVHDAMFVTRLPPFETELLKKVHGRSPR